MKAWQLVEPKKFASIDIDAPNKPGRGQALIRTLRMGICGTDISCYLGKFPFLIILGFRVTNWVLKCWKSEKEWKM